jgi:hypothetical protein
MTAASAADHAKAIERCVEAKTVSPVGIVR